MSSSVIGLKILHVPLPQFAEFLRTGLGGDHMHDHVRMPLTEPVNHGRDKASRYRFRTADAYFS